MNIEYLKILKSFKTILKSFTKSRKEIIRIIDIQSSVIGDSLNKIISLIDKSSDSIKIREQPENEKFKLIEDILFNANYLNNINFLNIYNKINLYIKKT